MTPAVIPVPGDMAGAALAGFSGGSVLFLGCVSFTGRYGNRFLLWQSPDYRDGDRDEQNEGECCPSGQVEPCRLSAPSPFGRGPG